MTDLIWYRARTDVELWHIAETAQQSMNRRERGRITRRVPLGVDLKADRADLSALHAAALVLNERRTEYLGPFTETKAKPLNLPPLSMPRDY